MQRIAAAVAGLYGLIALVGGTIGYVKAGSLASLIAGGGSGLLLIAGAIVARRRPAVGLGVASVVSLVLVARFAKAAMDSGLGALALTMIGGGLLVVLLSALALFGRDRPAVPAG
jgi:uncharacterized membrane protein (UPF0136 family)